ncbi:4-hydroxymandelate oxidase [Actinokineospora baliensis]|uniref:alpha-hydroxy acid oxidase n=1 Tax=Actinokineospora baliensis TaxID=547056 RepID=UPI00195E4040|nr:alpha-hydroxy acid oxidase [Actinokineospora baliensis]MBM7772911.1 4-hydroxymandelate oxidase [Actinokineospora baliensis]
MGDLLCLEDWQRAAQARLPGPTWGFLEGGSGAEVTVAANRVAFDRRVLRPRVLVDVTKPDLGTSLLGDPVRAPIAIAPMAYHRLVHPDGEVATAHAAGVCGLPFVVSMFASRTLADIAAATTAPLWLQLYWLRKRDALVDLVRRAEAAGVRALVLTVDAPRVATRPRDLRSGFTLPAGVTAANIDPAAMNVMARTGESGSSIQSHSREQFDASITFTDLAWLRELTPLPLLLKGILTAADAGLALDHGVDGIVVSNHGGRQLDSAIPAIDALEEVAEVVSGRVPVFVDGGVRRGTDVLKALALGADAVLLGRPVLHGLAVAGAGGAAAVLSTLRDELEEAMVLSGAPRLSDVDAGLVR